ncbi:MAG TPA: four helix bundle protein [Acidimicrobiia bacterium]|nr:four helix bundle protein [Acidimicrobiia bacterium]
MHDHTKLRVWSEACDLTVSVYRLTELLPDSERFELTRQMRRAAVSIASNISEGASKGSNPEFRRFLRIAAGSSAELATQLHLVHRLGYASEADVRPVDGAVQTVRRMLRRLIATLALDE